MSSEHRIIWDDAKVSRLWNYYSRHRPFCDEYFAKVYGRFVLRRLGLPLRQPLEVLDYGCGPGFVWDHLSAADARWRYTGLEFSNDSLDAFKARSRSNDRGEPRTIAVRELPSELPSATFDLVLLLEVVEHLEDARLHATLAEVARVLKPGGVLAITTPNDEDLELESRICPECGSVFHQWQHVRSWTADSLQAALEPHGFRVARLWRGHWDDHHLLGWIYNRAARHLLGRRRDPHMLGIFTRQPYRKP